MTEGTFSQKDKVLFFAHTPLWTSPHAQLLELLWAAHDVGCETILLVCDQTLTSCPANPAHSLWLCQECSLRSQKTVRDLIPPSTKVLPLDLDAQPSIEKAREAGNMSDTNALWDLEWKTMPIGELTLSQMADDALDYVDVDFAKGARALSLIDNGIRLFERVYDLIQSESITVVLVWNGRRPSDGPVIHAARVAGVRHLTYWWETGALMHVYKGTKVHDIDMWQEAFLSWLRDSRPTADDLARGDEFFSHQKGETPNSLHRPRFSDHFRPGVSLPSSGDKKRLVFFTTTPSEVAYMKDHLKPGLPIRDSFDLVQLLASEPRILERFQVVVRWHPNTANAGPITQEKLRRTISEQTSCVHIPPDSAWNSYDILEEADVVVTVGSTMGLEAAFHGKPSVLLGRAPWERVRGISTPDTWNEFVELACSPLAPPQRNQARLFGAFIMSGNHQLQHVRMIDHHRATFRGVDLARHLRSRRYRIVESLKGFAPRSIKALLSVIIG